MFKYEELTRNNTTYLWYFPDGRPSSVETSTSPEATPTDGWGSSAMMYALAEGLAGVVDCASLFRSLVVAPRWAAAGCRSAEVTLAYPASGAWCGYRYEHDPVRRSIDITLRGNATVQLHLLLPAHARAGVVTLGKRQLPFRSVRVGASRYVDASFRLKGETDVRIAYLENSK